MALSPQYDRDRYHEADTEELLAWHKANENELAGIPDTLQADLDAYGAEDQEAHDKRFAEAMASGRYDYAGAKKQAEGKVAFRETLRKKRDELLPENMRLIEEELAERGVSISDEPDDDERLDYDLWMEKVAEEFGEAAAQKIAAQVDKDQGYA